MNDKESYEELRSMLLFALKDLEKVSVCGTCIHYRPHGHKTKCDIKKLWLSDGNWAGCSRWQWRGLEIT